MSAKRDLLFELGTEELPPRTLQTLSSALNESLQKGLREAGIAQGAAQSFATPRRLAVLIRAVADRAPDRNAERRGPPLSAAYDSSGHPTQAAAAFARSCGVEAADLERLITEKGSWLVYRGIEPGAATIALLGDIVPSAVAQLPIAKRMRWGARSAEFARPVHWVLLLFGEEVVPIEVLGVRAGRVTRGHRFHAPRAFSLTSPKSYAGRLRRARVIADFDARRESIRAQVTAAAETEGGTAQIENALLDEVTGLTEWPVALVGRFETRFLSLPREVVIATIADHQRCFAIRGPDGSLTGGFVAVCNIASRDPAKVREGYERVVRPRLADAAFFWEQDRKFPLAVHAAALSGVTFQARLGSYADKTQRVKALAILIGERIAAGGLVGPAAELAKADLMTAMVGEFPELQGIMGRYYAQAEGYPPELALAIEEHYRPRYAGDALATTKTGLALALADKIDTLVGIFAIEQHPTGTRDPFGLRRAALGVLRMLLERRLELDLRELIAAAAALQPVANERAADEVYDFIAERFRGLLLERSDGTSAEMIDAVQSLRLPSPLDAEARLTALREFLRLPQAHVLTAMNKRIANILRKTPSDERATVDVAALALPAERGLHRVLAALSGEVARALAARRYADSLHALIPLGGAVNEFFDGVMVMDEDPARRANRLALLREAQRLLAGVADLSRLPG